jgi:xanthine/CO dehydrogenase XdhC/CoxF family maturation factor
VHLVIYDTKDGSASLVYWALARQRGSAVTKVIVITEPGAEGPVLVRSASLAGAKIGFGTPNADEIRLELSPSGSTVPVGIAFIPRPGCYVIQVDGRTFQHGIIVEVRS